MEKNLHAKLTIRLYRENKCFGPGIAELLERVEVHHSLRAAAQSMNMAYSKAWTMVRSCEAELGRKLLVYSTGGHNGGGATLTEDAARLLAGYRSYCKALEDQGEALFQSYFGPFLDGSGES